MLIVRDIGTSWFRLLAIMYRSAHWQLSCVHAAHMFALPVEFVDGLFSN